MDLSNITPLQNGDTLKVDTTITETSSYIERIRLKQLEMDEVEICKGEVYDLDV